MKSNNSFRSGILSAIGQTPLVRLDKIFKDSHFQLFAKLEGANPGGSMKDRAAVKILRQAMESGMVGADTVVIESSSGNMGIGLAQACAYYGLRLICVIDPKTTGQNIGLLQAYGAEVEMVRNPDPATGEYLQARLDRVSFLCASIPNSFWPNQYANVHNAAAHHETMREIAAALENKVDFLFCAVSTCGTLRGCAEYIREQKMATTVIAVDAIGSRIFDGPHCKRLIPGHGASVRPALLQPGLAQRCVHVSDLDCVLGCRRLARREAIMAGGSSGGVIAAIDSIQSMIPVNTICVAILPDRGERYLETIYSDSWVAEHFGGVSQMDETMTLQVTT